MNEKKVSLIPKTLQKLAFGRRESFRNLAIVSCPILTIWGNLRSSKFGALAPPKCQLLKRFGYTLIEVLLTFGLTAILSTFLLTSLIQYIRHSRDIEKAEKIIFTRAHLQQRLTTLFYPMKGQDKEEFYTKENTLCFEFENGIDHDKAFSGRIKGELFLKKTSSSKKKFSLCLKIMGDKEHVREEILLTGVKAMQFQFYDSQKADGSIEKKMQWEKEKERPMFFVLKIIPAKEGAENLHFPLYLRQDTAGLNFFK